MLLSTIEPPSDHRALGTNDQICRACWTGVWKCAQCTGETLLALLRLKIWFIHQLFFYHIRRHERPPRRAGPGKCSGGLWSLVIGCSALWLTGHSPRLSSKLGCWHSPKVRTAPTDNGDAVAARPRSLCLHCCSAQGQRDCPTDSTELSSWIPSLFDCLGFELFLLPTNSWRRLLHRSSPSPRPREMAEKRRSPCALSVKAHAFSVEALIGAEKRRRTAEEDAASPGYEDGTDVSDLTGSPGLRADRACTSDRGSEAECDGSRKWITNVNNNLHLNRNNNRNVIAIAVLTNIKACSVILSLKLLTGCICC